MTGKGKFEELRNFPCANVHHIFHIVNLPTIYRRQSKFWETIFYKVPLSV